jgi:hypothetical protein
VMNNTGRGPDWIERNIGWLILLAIGILVFGCGTIKF